MSPAEIISWSEAMDAAGKRDAMGGRLTDWKLAIRNPDGSAMRDQHGRQIFETQAEYKARQRPAQIGQTMDMFA